MGEVEYAPGEPKGTPWHPHRGFETVTYIMDGIFEHQDSNGGGGVITNGDTQWMTAGAGILHIEKPPEHLVVSGGLFHGLQLWVNLPKAREVGGAAVPGPPRQRGRLARVGRRGRARARDRRRPRRAGRARRHLHPDDHGARHARPRRDARGCRGIPRSTRSPTSSPAPEPSGTERIAGRDRPAGRVRGRRRDHRPQPRRSRRAVRPRWRCCSSAADPSASPSHGWGRSS